MALGLAVMGLERYKKWPWGPKNAQFKNKLKMFAGDELLCSTFVVYTIVAKTTYNKRIY